MIDYPYIESTGNVREILSFLYMKRVVIAPADVGKNKNKKKNEPRKIGV